MLSLTALIFDYTFCIWSDKDKRALVKKPEIIRAIDHGNEDIARILAIDRVIEYINMSVKILPAGSMNT